MAHHLPENQNTYRTIYQRAKDVPNNIYYTPSFAIDYVYDFIKPFTRVWEPCCGQGHITRYLEERGPEVLATDITQGDEFDFYTYAPPPDSYDIIVTNPPFQKKSQTFQRLFELGKPFAILMPTGSLDSVIVRRMLKAHDGEWGVILPDKTINFIPHTQEDAGVAIKATRASRSFFHSSWFTWNVPGSRNIHII